MKIKFIGSDEDMPDLTIGKVYITEYEDDEPTHIVSIVDDVGDRTAVYCHEYEVVEE